MYSLNCNDSFKRLAVYCPFAENLLKSLAASQTTSIDRRIMGSGHCLFLHSNSSSMPWASLAAFTSRISHIEQNNPVGVEQFRLKTRKDAGSDPAVQVGVGTLRRHALLKRRPQRCQDQRPGMPPARMLALIMHWEKSFRPPRIDGEAAGVVQSGQISDQHVGPAPVRRRR